MRRFRITCEGRSSAYAGVEFEVEDDASEAEIAEAAADAVAEYLSYGWEEIEGDRDE